MMRQITTLGACLLLVACDSSITNSASTPSPDGTKTIAVVEELQGANDPTSWWKHISLRENEEDLRKIPGNLLKLDGRGSVTATWNGNSEVTIFIDDALFSQTAATSTEKQGVQITFRRASDRTETNSEQDGAEQPATAPESMPENNSNTKPEGSPQ
ncbi:hypothetical protein N9B73_01730 [Verrucomicrobiales bacterium]|nr:hypothetical protein [Verrucomicrobiales bacterium]